MRLAVALFALSLAAAPRTVLTSETLFDWRTPSSPQISPDGQKVAYLLETEDKMADVFYSNLWIVDVDGKNARPISAGSHRDASPRWSPDGGRLAYVSGKGGRPQIYVRWMDTGAEAKITDLETAPSALSWSPDGQSIAFLARVPGKSSWSVKMPAAPPGAKWADTPTIVTKLNWRADGVGGNGKIPEGYNHVFVVPAAGGAPRQISTGDFQHAGEPAWSADGTLLYVSGRRVPNADMEQFADDIYSFNVKTGDVKQLTTRKGPDLAPSVSPDGRRIAYLGFDDKGQANHNTNLYVMNLDGSGSRQLAANLDRNVISPRWMPDSKGLFAVVEDKGQAQVHAIPLDAPAKPITSGYYRFATAYASLDTMSVSKTGTIAVSRTSPAEPKELYAFSAATPGKLTRLTYSNDSLLADRDIGAVEEINYPSFDGKNIQGWIIKPPNFDPSKKYPLILDIHGGPYAMYGIEFNHQMQIFAARGFVVLYTNPRGSTGYGEAFGDIIHGKYPGDDYKDLMAGVDAVLAKGYVDPKKLCVTGGSGGGILTAWIVTQTTRFAAAVSQYPVTNWITQFGSSDIPLTTVRWMKGTPWDNLKSYVDHSPVFFVNKVKTPTMLITGEEDWRTPIVESEEFYAGLKMNNVDTVLVRIPREPHGIRGASPSHRIAKIEHILGWMEKYVK